MECIGLLAPVVDYLIKPVVRQVGYLIHYKSNVEILDAQTKDLVHAKERLQHDVDEELRKVSNIKTARFVHSSGFLACTETLEDAYLFAENAIKNKE